MMEFDRGTLYLLFGLTLVVGSLWAGSVLWETKYSHSLDDETAVDFNESRDGHLRYANLSSRGKTVVDRTIDREEYVVKSESETVPAFSYNTDYAMPGDGLYVIQRDGRNYSLHTSRDSSGLLVVPITVLVLVPTIVTGGLLCRKGLQNG